MGNPYSEKDCEFETEPTPRNSKSQEIKQNYFRDISSKSQLNVKFEQGRIIMPQISVESRDEKSVLRLTRKSVRYSQNYLESPYRMNMPSNQDENPEDISKI